MPATTANPHFIAFCPAVEGGPVNISPLLVHTVLSFPGLREAGGGMGFPSGPALLLQEEPGSSSR